MAINLLKRCVTEYRGGRTSLMNLDVIRGAAMCAAHVLNGTFLDLCGLLKGTAKTKAQKLRERMRAVSPTASGQTIRTSRLDDVDSIIEIANDMSDYLRETYTFATITPLPPVALHTGDNERVKKAADKKAELTDDG